MTDYKNLYLRLFNRITDAIELLDNGEILSAKDVLIAAQQQTEEEYIEDD